MTFKTGDRVIVNSGVWAKNEPGTVIPTPNRFAYFRSDDYAVQFDSYAYEEDDCHRIHESAMRLEVDDTPDAISPSHYQFPGGIQVIDLTRHLGFLEGNIVKYVARAGRKGAAKEDLLKARQYLDWLIEDADA